MTLRADIVSKNRFANGRLTIDLDALAANWRDLASKASRAGCAAVVKANGYGLGAAEVSRRLAAEGCRDFFTASLDEAVIIREALPEVRLYCFDGFNENWTYEYRAKAVRPVLNSLRDVLAWLATNRENMHCALHFDTGMSRLGLPTSEISELAGQADWLKRLSPSLLMSHFACADEPDDPMNDRQISAFEKAASLFPGVPRSLANSAGVFLGHKAHYDLLRPGISIYGGEAVNNVPNPMRPVVKLEGRILQMREANKGESVGYGAEHVLTRNSVIAVAGIGYADGYHRSASGAGVPLRRAGVAEGARGMIGKHELPILGRVSMDLIAFDATDLPPSVRATAKWIEMLNETITVDDVARSAGTIGYEILTSLGARYERVYSSR